MNSSNGKLTNVVEAMLFAAAEPLPAAAMCRVLEGIQAAQIQEAVAALNERYLQAGNSFRIREIAGGFQLYTLPEYSEYIEELLTRTKTQRLSAPALETLAVIAYRQPVSTPEIEKIRGVECSGVLRTLLERNLIAIVGRSDGPGRPLLYGTTNDFLYYFGLNEITELPRLEELERLLESRDDSVQLSIALEPQAASRDAVSAERAAEEPRELDSSPGPGRLTLKRPFPESLDEQGDMPPPDSDECLPEATVEVSPISDEAEEDDAGGLLHTAKEVLTTPVE